MWYSSTILQQMRPSIEQRSQQVSVCQSVSLPIIEELDRSGYKTKSHCSVDKGGWSWLMHCTSKLWCVQLATIVPVLSVWVDGLWCCLHTSQRCRAFVTMPDSVKRRSAAPRTQQPPLARNYKKSMRRHELRHELFFFACFVQIDLYMGEKCFPITL